MPDLNNTIYREMVLGLIYRLRLAAELFCRVTDMVMSAMSMDDADGRHQAVEQLHACAQSIQIIHSEIDEAALRCGMGGFHGSSSTERQ